MKEKYIRIDMDYELSPVWFSYDGKEFINGDIYELKVNEKTIESLKYYQYIWYKLKKSEKTIINDPYLGKFKEIESYVENLAKAIARELKDKIIFVWDYKNLKNKEVN